MKIIVRGIRTGIDVNDADVCRLAVKKMSSLLDVSARYPSWVCRRSVDARRRVPYLVRSVIIETQDAISAEKVMKFGGEVLKEGADPVSETVTGLEIPSARPVVVGFGPAGMFAALALAERGYRPVVIERGDPVAVRSARVAEFMRTGSLDTESNVQFGAGGAGTFSDGKLVTRINDEKVSYVLKRFAGFGAPSEILVSAKPHVGTDRLLKIVSNIDARIRELGGEIHYRTRCDSFVRNASGLVCAVRTPDGEIPCGQVILAVGNGARDTFEYLASAGFDIVPKPFSVGVRIEHLQERIDEAMYGNYAGDPRLGHAEYALSHRTGGDCVYTFCMCPGGEVIASASEDGGVVTNGMSRYLRNGRNANSAVVVNVENADPVSFQRKIERAAFRAGGGGFAAPFDTVGHFLGTSCNGPDEVVPTYMGGNVRRSDIASLFPERVSRLLREGIAVFGKKIDGFDSPSAVVTGAETRTSSPYRIPRGGDSTCLCCGNVYPAGEGAGYAGGITSSAVDGLRAAIAVISRYRPYPGD